MSQSPFFRLSLSDLKTVCDRNSLTPLGRRNWRKSFVNTLEKKEYPKLMLEEDEFSQIFEGYQLDDGQVTQYKVELTGRKRSRDEVFGEDERGDENEPAEKKRKVEETPDEVLEELFELLSRKFSGTGGRLRAIRSSNSSKSEQMDEYITHIKSAPENLNPCTRKLIFLIEYYRHKVPREDWRRIFDGARNNDSSAINNFFISQICPIYLQAAENYFKEGIVGEDDDDEETANQQVERAVNIIRTDLDIHISNMVERVVGRKLPPICEGLEKKTKKRKSRPIRRVDLQVKDCKGTVITFTLNGNTAMRKVFVAYCKHKKLGENIVRFYINGNRMNLDLTPDQLGLKDRQIIDAFLSQSGGKPVILLYPPHDNFDINSVCITLSPQHWTLRCYYPDFVDLSSHQEEEEEEEEVILPPQTVVEWKDMKVNRDGKILFKNERMKPKSVEYLFWESNATSIFDFNDHDLLYVLPTSKITGFMYHQLMNMGMNEKETNNMICYWLMQMKGKKYVMIQFINQQEYERMVSLDISPRPDIIIKIFMLFITFDSLDQINEQKKQVLEKNLSKIAHPRNKNEFDGKFVAIEWGGMNLNLSKFLKL